MILSLLRRCGCLGAALLVGSAPLVADIPWRRDRVSLSADRKPAADVLRAFALEQGLPVDLTESVASASISGEFDGLTPRQFLDAVCDAGEFVWFWDGSRLHIAPAAQSRSRLLELPQVTLEQAQAAFESLGFASGPAARSVGLRGAGGVLTLSGSPAFLEVAEPVLRALESQARTKSEQADALAAQAAEASRAQASEMQVRVFRLKHATAGDLTIRGGGAQTVVPGVARALQNIMGTASGSLSTGSEGTDRKRARPSLFGTGLAAVGRDEPAPAAESGGTGRGQAARGPQPGGLESEGERALIQAEPRLNAVIVRDTVARLPLYASLIEQLDVASPVIEISAAVVDIDADNGKSLGVEFLSFGDGRSGTKARLGFEADRAFNQGDGDNSGSTPAFVDGTNVVRGAGLSTSVLVPVSGYELLTRIRALEEKGEAQLVTSPSVITLENVEASLRQEETVFVRVAGRDATDLFDVRAGVQLRVTPTLVQDGDEITFRLVVDVQDGSFSDLRVDGVPSTRESAISTQAVVPGDKTLLIGGYFVERQNNNVRQVPVLGNVPVVGRLFQRSENNRSRAQRFFFITPRLVDVHRESRLNRPGAAVASSPLPKAATDPDAVARRAHDLVGRSLAPRVSDQPQP